MIIDIVIIILVLLGGFAGYRKGLVSILVSLIGLVLAIVLACTLQTPVANTLYNTSFGSTIEQTITSGINDAIKNKDKVDGEEVTKENFYDAIVKNIVNGEEVTKMAKNVTMFILKGISFISVFIVVLLICYILSMILNLVFNLPLLDIVNKIGGVGAGTLKTLVGIWIIFAIISVLSPVPFMSGIVSYVKNSAVANLLYTNNLFVKIIGIGLN